MRITESQLRKMVRRQLIREKRSAQIKKCISACFAASGRRLNENVKASEILEDIQKILYVMAAKEVGGKVWESVKEEFGPAIVEGIVKMAGAIPIVGSFVNAASALGGFLKGGFNVFQKTKEAKEAAGKILDIAEGEYGADIDDEKAEKDPIAKILNIDDRMEAPLKKNFLEKFLSTYVKYLKTRPDMEFSSKQAAAEETLERYMKTIGQWKEVEGPGNPF